MRGAGWPGTVQTRVDGVCNWQRSVRGRPGLWTRRRVGAGGGEGRRPPLTVDGKAGQLWGSCGAAAASGLLVNVDCAPFLVLIGCSAAGALLFLLAWAAAGGGGGCRAARPARPAPFPAASVCLVRASVDGMLVYFLPVPGFSALRCCCRWRVSVLSGGDLSCCLRRPEASLTVA